MIKINQLWFSYTGMTSYVLSDINVEIPKGEYVSVIGENGSGKTTLIRLLLGKLKPTKGSVSINAKFIGYVPQRNDFTNVNFPITVYEVLFSYFKLLKLKDKSVITEVLRITGMEGHKKSLMGNLSGGQTQKILISRALMGTPDLLILDEPSTGVDMDSQTEIYGLLKRMSLEKQITIVAIEHNLQAAFKNSSKIFHIQNGQGHLCNPDHYTKENSFTYRED
ncbi:MAG: metal ABC transporter ATP-binding protein [Mobilitalea sp.]